VATRTTAVGAMADILTNFFAALIFCYFFIKEKVGGSGFKV
jgi:hypothetical protein